MLDTATPFDRLRAWRRHGDAAKEARVPLPRRVPASPRPRVEPGFTLLEVLVTLSILSLVVTSLYAVLVSTMRTRDILDREIEGPRDALAVLELMSEDLRAAILPADVKGANFVGKDGRSADGRDADQANFLATVSSKFPRDPRRLRREEIPLDAEGDPEVRSELCEISYLLKGDPQSPGRMHLYRREDFHVDEDPKVGGTYLRLHSRVRSLKLRYWSGTEREKNADPADKWDAAEKKSLPVAVSIELSVETTADDGEAERDARVATYRAVVPVAAGKPPPAEPSPDAAPRGGPDRN